MSLEHLCRAAARLDRGTNQAPYIEGACVVIPVGAVTRDGREIVELVRVRTRTEFLDQMGF